MSTSTPHTTSTPSTSNTAPTSQDPSQTPTEPDPERTAQARTAITTHLNAIGGTHLQPLEQRAGDIKGNSEAIERQKSALEKQTRDLEKESNKLQKEATQTSDKLKELGDIQNWAEVLERDIRVMEETVRMGEGERMEWEDDEGDNVTGEEGSGHDETVVERRGVENEPKKENTRAKGDHTQNT